VKHQIKQKSKEEIVLPAVKRKPEPKTSNMRGRKSRIDMSSEAGRLLFKDMVDFQRTGYNPFVLETITSKKFWKSREEYWDGAKGGVAFGAFKAQAQKLAEIVKVQMPAKDRKKEEKKIKMKKKSSASTLPTTADDASLNASLKLSSLSLTDNIKSL
jgi:hypothetical protein